MAMTADESVDNEVYRQRWVQKSKKIEMMTTV